jgi:hypothetical protein
MNVMVYNKYKELLLGLNIDVMKLISQNNNIYLQPEQLLVYKYK